MNRILLLLSLIVLNSPTAYANNLDISKVQWAPTMEDVLDETDIKLLVFFRKKPIGYDKCKGIDKFEEIARITNSQKIETVMKSIEEDSNACGCEDKCGNMFIWPTWMGIVNKNNQGFLINVGWNHLEERVEWWGSYSDRLYDVLVEYGIIKPTEKNLFVRDPNVIRFTVPSKNHLQKKSRVITTFMERDLDQLYIEIDPNTTPVYVKVDPNTPGVYIAVDSNVVLECVKKLSPAINMMSDQPIEFMAQNRWLAQILDRYLEKFETERGLQPIADDSKDYLHQFKPSRTKGVPYAKPQTKPLLKETPDINKVRASMNLQCLAAKFFLNCSRENIKNFEKRLKRLEDYPEK